MSELTIEKGQTKVNTFLLAGLKNLREVTSGLSIEEFTINTLELLMHLERDEHLNNLKKDNLKDKGNGTYTRSFKSLSRNSLMINIPRTRYTDFKPLAMEFLKYGQEQVNDLKEVFDNFDCKKDDLLNKFY